MKNPSSSSASLPAAARPWFREPWPWILMSGPAAVLVAGAFTTWIAFSTKDGLVAEDYYKRGLAINKELRKEDAAQRLGISAQFFLEGNRLRIKIEGAAPEALFVQLMYATREGNDVRLRLARVGDAYEAALPPLAPGHWRAIVEDPQGTWRIVKERL
ncbi:MAG: FixH family protein [Clostridia bacterium]